MNHPLKFVILLLAILLMGCKDNQHKANTTQADAAGTTPSEFIISGNHPEEDATLLRVAFIGDAEPKPLAEFPNMANAVAHLNTLAHTRPIDFVIGIGDIAHKGTEIQYEGATRVLQNLTLPFYPIMGNEEHGSSVEQYLHYAQKWNAQIVSPSYVINHEKLTFIFASPDHGRELEDSTANWILDHMKRVAPKPVVLVVHGAQQGVYPENAEKGISNQLFREQVISQANLAVVVSGDLHMDMDRVDHSKLIDRVHYLHIPALERTKIPDETNHTPMLRVMTITKAGSVHIDTYAVGDFTPLERHAYSFSLSL